MAFCAHCGSRIDEGSFCTSCGRAIGSQAGATAVAAKPAPAKEHAIYENQSVLVTDSRFVVPGKTYAVSLITSVGMFSIPVKIKGPVITVLFGVLIFFAAFFQNSSPGAPSPVTAIFMGLLIIAAGVYWFRSRFVNQVHGVALRTASGEERPITDKNKQFIQDVAAALDEAIVRRAA
jgi:hypothetical protein